MADDRQKIEQRHPADGEDDELRYVLKEGKRIGDGYFLVEMATDGRTLTISAYDGDTQRTLELLVNEKNHRKLYREANGDYSSIASRLRVEGDRLLLDAATASAYAQPSAPAGGEQQRAMDADELVV